MCCSRTAVIDYLFICLHCIRNVDNSANTVPKTFSVLMIPLEGRAIGLIYFILRSVCVFIAKQATLGIDR